MRIDSLKRKLGKPDKVQSRNSTINSQFSRAIASYDRFDEEVVKEAILALGQDPSRDLVCVYCRNPASGWDHLYGITRNKEYTGFGHQMRNLVPCCASCNSSKGNKDWRDFVATKCTANSESLVELLSEYSRDVEEGAISAAAIKDICPDLMGEYYQTQSKILELMAEADRIADQIRDQVDLSAGQKQC
ncbi:HNH endonuclease [Parvibaculaceae bacterium PLY_AMNH_Bact1]|nr:HNH endonuclease [Parvibaculaceae bacterium PLY_AMNH_Bact1]